MTRRQSLLAASLVLTAACRDSQPTTPPSSSSTDPTAVVARFQGGEIRRGEIRAAIETRLASAPKPISIEVRREVVRRIVERRVRAEMLFREATAQGYADQPAVQAQMLAAEELTLAEDLLEGETAVRASDELVAAEVDRRLAAPGSEESRKFSHIFLRSASADLLARRRATEQMVTIRQQLANGVSFNELAKRHSTSIKARDGGRIEWTTRRGLPKALGDVIFMLQEGQVSDVIATRDGLHLFRLDGIRPAKPTDVEAIRRLVRQELDAEARVAAARGRRQQELDSRGVSAPSDPTERQAMENRLLAAARRQQGLSPEIEARVQEARRNAVINAYRSQLMETFDTEPSEEDVLRFHRQHAQDALFLRDFELDVLFFPQSGESAADVYAAGEAVGTALRDGKSFDDLLDRPARPEARLCRSLHRANLEAIGRTSIRLRKAILNLAVGEVSPAVYLDGPRTEVVPGKCTLDGRGVAFVRLRNIGTLSVADARQAILAALREERVAASVSSLQDRLIAASGLEILMPEG